MVYFEIMKSSLKFREERGPLLRIKVPFKVAGIPLSSGITLGNSEDLAFHVRTLFQAGPCVKISFRPNHGSGLSLILKAGLGAWGSPNSAFTLAGELLIPSSGKDASFFLRLEPRAGDFSLRREARLEQRYLIMTKDGHPAPLVETKREPDYVQMSDNGDLSCMNPIRIDSSPISTPPADAGDSKGAHKRGGFNEKDKPPRSSSVDSSNVVIGSKFSLKIEGLDKERKGWKSKSEDLKEHDMELESVGGSTCDEEESKIERQKLSLSLGSMRSALQDCNVLVHSSLPVGNRNCLHVRWGMKPPSKLLHGWDGSLQSFAFFKLPSLVVDKISFERVSLESKKPKDACNGKVHPDFGLMPFGFLEGSQELSEVAALCYSMKRQLQLMYTENKVLRQAMQDMKTQVEFRGGLGSNFGNVSVEEQTNSKLAREDSHRNAEVRKNHRDGVQRDMNEKASNVSADGLGLSKELEQAITNAKGGVSGAKN